jgi:hypothetical protein
MTDDAPDFEDLATFDDYGELAAIASSLASSRAGATACNCNLPNIATVSQHRGGCRWRRAVEWHQRHASAP